MHKLYNKIKIVSSTKVEQGTKEEAWSNTYGGKHGEEKVSQYNKAFKNISSRGSNVQKKKDDLPKPLRGVGSCISRDDRDLLLKTIKRLLM